ncbi:MAG: hypothetical protein WCK73_14535 [Deltaproteobacteria bacterium]
MIPTPGWAAILEDDERRRLQLDANLATWRADADEKRKHSGQTRRPAKYRDRRRKVAEVAP